MNDSIFRKFFANTNIVILFLVTLLVLFVRLRLLNIPFERDEGEYAYAGQSLLQGLLPYRDFYNMKMPGTYFAFALIIKYLGHNAAAIRLTTLCINFINAGLVYKIAKTRLQLQESIIATSVYLLLSLTYEAQGWVSNSEHFVLLPALTGIYILSLFEKFDNLKQNILLVVSGMALMAAFLTKQHAFGYLIFAGLWLGFISLEKRVNVGSCRTLIIRYFFFGIGCLLPVIALATYLDANHLFEPFYFLTFKYAAAYTSLVSPPLRYISNFRPIFWNSFVHWVVFFAVIRVLSFSKWSGKVSSNLEDARFLRVYLLLFIGCSFICVCPGLYFRPHYFQLMFPAASFLIALGLGRCTLFWIKTSQKAQLTPVKLQGMALCAFLIAQFGYLFSWTPHKILLDMYDGDSFTEIRMIGETLSKRTKPNDKIGMLGAEPQIFFYANRVAASGFLYHYPLIEHQKYATTMSEQFVKEIEATRPEIFIYSYQINDITHNQLTCNYLNNWKKIFCKDYEVIGKVYKDLSKHFSLADLRWKHLSQDISSDSSVVIEIFKRK
ncbi:MAG: hypothetical protein RIS64_1946 [Bacteroidota bacterium]